MGTFKSIWGLLKRDTSSRLKKKKTLLTSNLCVCQNTSLSSCPFFWLLPLACQRSVILLRHLPECRGYLVSQREGGAAKWDHTLCTVRNIKSHIFIFFFRLILSLDVLLGSFHASQCPVQLHTIKKDAHRKPLWKKEHVHSHMLWVKTLLTWNTAR